jgi:uncharacterized protein (DUF58 family)
VRQIRDFVVAARAWWRTIVRWIPRAAQRRLNRGLAADRRIEPRIVWPVWLIPVVIINQLLAPHPVWVVLSVSIVGLYWVSVLWVRSQANTVHVSRRRLETNAAGDGNGHPMGSSAALVVGDSLQEEFLLVNQSNLPVLWAEVEDHSTVPDYQAGCVVAGSAQSDVRWKREAVCKRRGVFNLGPHTVRLQDPFGLFSVVINSARHDVVLIYPRVVQLPPVLPTKAEFQGADRQRRPLHGTLPAATITDYRPGDSLRYVHWASTARTGRLMVKDQEIEPGGSVWVVLDLEAAAQLGSGDAGTLEFGVVVAASVVAQLLNGREQRAVGLLAYSGGLHEGPVEVMPGRGGAYLWPVLTALAQVEAGRLPLADLLASSRDRFGRRTTLVLVVPRRDSTTGDGLIAQIAQLQAAGVGVQVIWTTAGTGDSEQPAGSLDDLFAQLGVRVMTLQAGEPMTSLFTFRRRRTILRSTPTGGVIRTEIEEEVG